jgi:hypothetical protein
MHVVDLQDQAHPSARGGIASGRRNRSALEQEYDISYCCQSMQSVLGAWISLSIAVRLDCDARLVAPCFQSLHDRVCTRESALKAQSAGDVWKDSVR